MKGYPLTRSHFQNFSLVSEKRLNPGTYTPIHTPTVVLGWGGGVWIKSLPGVFDMWQYFETILLLLAFLDFTKNYKSG